MKSIVKNKKGFTLIETIVYMALLVVLLLVITNIFLTILDLQVNSQGTSSVEQDSRFFIARLDYDLNRGQSFTIYGANGHNDPPITSGAGSELDIPICTNTYQYSLASNSNGGYNLQLKIVDSNGSTLGTYKLNNYQGNGNDVLSTHISNLSFTRVTGSGSTGNRDSVVVSYTLTSNANRKYGTTLNSINYETSIGLR